MTVTFTKINTLDDVEFDTLFDDSVVHLDSNFIWPGTITTLEEKRQSYRERLQAAIDGDMSLASSPNSRFLMYKVEIGSKDVMVNAGFIDAVGSYKTHWYLTSPDATNSRNWLYTQAMDDARSNFFAEEGITSYKVLTFVDSPLYRLIKSRFAANRNVILDEYPTIEGENPQNLVTIVLQA